MILTDCQQKAYEQIQMFLNQPVGGMLLLKGSAGTGKSFLMKQVAQSVKSTRKRLLIAAPTHKALRVIEKFVDDSTIPFSTIHSALALTEYIDGYGKVTFKRQGNKIAPLVDYQVLILDEASMLQDDIYYDLPEFIHQGLKIIFVGDPYQLPPVGLKNAKPFDRNEQKDRNIKVFELKTPVRQAKDSAIYSLAETLKKRIFSPVGLINYSDGITPLDEVRFYERQAEMEAFNKILPLYKTNDYKENPDFVKVIAWRNKTVDVYNNIIRDYIYGNHHKNKIQRGENIILLDPIVDGNKVLASINEELSVVDYAVSDYKIDDEHSIKTYYTKVIKLKDGEELELPIVHEESEIFYQELLDLLKEYALSFKQGSMEARSAWMDYYAIGKKKYPKTSYGYAITAHRSQGSTYTHSIVSYWDALKNINIEERNRLFYTACTRPTTSLNIIKPVS